MKQAGQKSVKEDLPEQRKAPKRAVECQLKVQTHIWDVDAVGSNPATPTNPSIHMDTRIFFEEIARQTSFSWLCHF